MILIIDFGSQFNQLIARRVRECKIYCQVEPPTISLEKIIKFSPKGIIFSGGPSSVYEFSDNRIDSKIFTFGIPILGICYGMHFIVDNFGGKTQKTSKREYGFTPIKFTSNSKLFEEVRNDTVVWMSHGDSVKRLPIDFTIDGFTKNTKIAAISNQKKNIYGLQFHPEVEHTIEGKKIIKNFLLKICKCKQSWQMKSFISETVINIQNTVRDKNVILGLSGGIDSSVTAMLLKKAINKQLICIFVDNGLLLKNENKQLLDFSRRHLSSNNIRFIKSEKKFLNALKGITDPEEKRKIIGNLFIKIFEAEASKIKNVEYLAQGTLYPDIIESRSAFGGSTSLIKSHHNVGGLPENMKLKLVEPLKYLFKDEVRLIGIKMGLEDKIIWKQPFPGPGLAIRIIGEVTPEKLLLLRKADSILQEEIKSAGYYQKLWQSFAVLLPVKSVGIMGDQRTYENIISIRAVTSSDAMTADWAKLPHDLLAIISNRIINEVNGVNRVMYDISSKPPSTIELE